MHDLHQAQTLLYTFSGQAPQNPNLDPILYGELPMMANFEMAQFAKYGMPGVWTHGFVDMWSPGYLAFMSSNHNGMIRMYEIQGFSGANTQKMRLGNPNAAGRGGRAGGPGDGRRRRGGGTRQSESARVVPAVAGDRRLRLVAPQQHELRRNRRPDGAAVHLAVPEGDPRELLREVSQLDGNRAGRKPVAGYVIPARQRDMTRVERLVNLLRLQGIEIGRATAEVKLQEGTFPAGSFVIKRDQPYSRLAKTLLEKAGLPGSEPPHLRRRVVDDGVDEPGGGERDCRQGDPRPRGRTGEGKEIHLAGTLTGSGSTIAVAHYGSNNMVTLRYQLKDLKVQAAEKEFKQGDTTFPAGSFVIAGDAARVKSAVEALGLTAATLPAPPQVPLHDVDLPRVAIYSIWGNTQDIGWVRYAFDKFGVPYDLIYKERVKKGDLKGAYDVILMPNQGGSGKRLVFDIENRGQPIEYKKSEKFPNLGMYGESDDITGGMGLDGVAEFDKFVKAGGPAGHARHGELLPRGIRAGAEGGRGATSGAVLRTGTDHRRGDPAGRASDLLWLRQAHDPGALRQRAALSVQTGANPFEAPPAGPPPTPSSVLMRYPGGDEHVLSGLMRGANEIRNRAAIVDQASGKGRVILFAGNPCYRWQNFGEFNMLFNTLLNYNDIKTPPERPTTPTAGQ
jgi:hypothetical protein